eukprot:gene5929-8176_t
MVFSKAIGFILLTFLFAIQTNQAWNPSRTNFVSNSIPTSTNQIVTSKQYSVKAVTALSIIIAAISSIDSADAVDTPKKQKKPKTLETDLGIKYIEVKKGTGPYPNVGDFVIIDFIGFLSNGTVFDSTETKGRKPLSFRYGMKQIIPGIESVLDRMQVGGEATCIIPPNYAYGPKGICVDGEGCLVPPNETVKYVIKLRSVGAGYN